ncbi:MAG: GntG family PLP-dependent aldolase [Bacteroidota bacterium]
MIDLRSDTLTKPTPGMLEAMMSAEVGDDVFGEDPTVNALEQKCAKLFGMEAAIYCPSGTMTNQIGIRVLSNPYEEVICYEGAHIYKYEGGGVAGNSGLSFKLLKGDRGRLTLDEVKSSINPDDVHFPKSAVIELENTVNKGGGCFYKMQDIKPISEFGREAGLKLHLDGARLFNALVETGDDPKEYGQCFDTISICLSKGLGAPVGSVLLGSEENIKQARRVRKHFGGGMRQGGYLAAAGIYALDHHVDRLKEDHVRAKALGDTLETLSFVDSVLPVDTNIVIFKLARNITSDKFVKHLEEVGIRAVPFGPKEIRFVTHLNFDNNMLDRSIALLISFKEYFF